MSGWSDPIISFSAEMPEILEECSYQGRVSRILDVGLQHRELWVLKDAKYIIYDYVISNSMPVIVGATKGPISGKEVLRDHPELAELIHEMN